MIEDLKRLQEVKKAYWAVITDTAQGEWFVTLAAAADKLDVAELIKIVHRYELVAVECEEVSGEDVPSHLYNIMMGEYDES